MNTNEFATTTKTGDGYPFPVPNIVIYANGASLKNGIFLDAQSGARELFLYR